MDKTHKERLHDYGLRKFAEFRMGDDCASIINFVDEEVASKAGSIYAWLIDEEIVRIGSCKSTLRRRVWGAGGWLASRLQGRCEISNDTRKAKEIEDAKRWKAELCGSGKVAEVWGRQGTLVSTPLATINVYLSEENVLLGEFRPKFNNSHFR